MHFWNLAVHLNHPGKHENNSLWGPEPRNSDEEVQVWAWDVCWQQRFPWDGAAAHPGGGRREAAGAQEKMNYTSLHPGVRVGLKSLPICLLPSPSPHGEFGSSLHLVVRALTQVSRLQGSFYISVQWLSHVQLFGTPWIAARQASLSVTNSWSLFKLKSIESVMPFNRFTLCHPLLFLSSIFPSIRVFSNKSVLHIWWPRYWSFSFSISPSSEYSGLISFRMNWLDLLAVQGTLKSLL